MKGIQVTPRTLAEIGAVISDHLSGLDDAIAAARESILTLAARSADTAEP